MQIEKAAYAFQLDGNPVSCEEFGHGHIISTLKVYRCRICFAENQ